MSLADSVNLQARNGLANQYVNYVDNCHMVFNIYLFCSPYVGDVLIIGAQVVAASQMVLEEKFVSGLDIPALQAVGWEGK
jgi:hypothetical protein